MKRPQKYIEIHCYLDSEKAKERIYSLIIVVGRTEFTEPLHDGNRSKVMKLAKRLSKELGLPVYETHPTLSLVEVK